MKKDRSPNWEREEKEFLLETISSRIDIIEDKSNDVESTKKKDKEWNDVKKLFDAKFGPREKKKLKEQYQRLKLKAKAEWREFEKKQKKTGGGPPPKPPGPLSEMLLKLLPDEFSSTKNPYDEDYSQSENEAPTTSLHANVSFLQCLNDKNEDESPTASQETAEDVPAKKRKCEVTAKDSMTQILEMHRREHEIRMKYIEDEHEMKVKEHRMKMEILNMKKEKLTTSCVIDDK